MLCVLINEFVTFLNKTPEIIEHVRKPLLKNNCILQKYLNVSYASIIQEKDDRRKMGIIIIIIIIIIIQKTKNKKHFYHAAVAIQISNLLICFCNFDLSCSILEKDTFMGNVCSVLCCLIK